ncbi:hypothetical protein Taro_049259 [Colocasia esculenta]|uniref:Uncharacterized protein n=1 Tax=Colocasia esculenta TaxID=4460 RepID=A0A843XAG7_COLES|nr:hypothetical protein [Colocasia esculenta]
MTLRRCSHRFPLCSKSVTRARPPPGELPLPGARRWGSQGRVEEFLAAGEAGDPHTKPFVFPVVSAATCTESLLEVDQRVVWRSSWQLGKQEIPTPSRSSSPLCLLRPAQTVFLKSTKGDYEVQEEEQVEDGNASE